MRTTLQLDDDVYRAAKALADRRQAPLGVVVSELARRGMAARTSFAERDGFPVFDVGPGARPITIEDVESALDDA